MFCVFWGSFLNIHPHLRLIRLTQSRHRRLALGTWRSRGQNLGRRRAGGGGGVGTGSFLKGEYLDLGSPGVQELSIAMSMTCSFLPPGVRGFTSEQILRDQGAKAGV